MSSPRLLTAAELAKTCRVHLNTIYALAREGEIPSIKVGRQWLFDYEEVIATLKAHSNTPATKEDAQ